MLRPITPQSADRLCVLLLGPAGIGKTSQLRCICGEDYRNGGWVKLDVRPEKVLVLSAESGLLCVRDLVANSQVTGFEIDNFDSFQEALRYCQSPAFKKEGYQWIFIDSLTEISARCAEHMQSKYKDENNGFKIWGDYTQSMTDVIKAFRDMPGVNVVFTCLISMDKDKIGRWFPAPDISGSSLKSRLTSYFDEVFVLDRKPVVFKDGKERESLVFCTREPVGLAKDRSGRLRAEEYPNLLLIKNSIIKEK